MEKEILQNLESPKWRRRLVIDICLDVIVSIACIIIYLHYCNNSYIAELLYLILLWIIAFASFICSQKSIARYLAIDDNNLIFKRIIGTTLLPLAEIVSVKKADDQLYGRKKDKLNGPDKETKRIFGRKATAYAGWCKRGTEHKYYLFSAQRDNHALITTKDGKLYVVDYENAEAIKRKAGLI